jgi:hypothetical protein
VADNSRFILEIEIDARGAMRSIEALASGLAALNGSLDRADRDLDAAERALARFSSVAVNAAASQREAAGQADHHARAVLEEGRALGLATTQLRAYERAQAAANRENQKAVATSAVASGAASRGAAAPVAAAAAGAPVVASGAARGATEEAVALSNAATVAEGAQKRLGQSLSTTRYAAFSAAGTLGLLSAGMVALGIASIAVASSWERSFANVVRTSDALRTNADAAAALRLQFVDLAQTIPLSFEALSSIGTLGNQLGVPAKSLAEFTKIVAEFSATTGITTDEAATAFGRLDSLLPGVAHNYNALGSAILAVGVQLGCD